MIGIVVASKVEARSLVKHKINSSEIWLNSRILVRVSGIGSKRAATAAEVLVQQGAKALISWGTAAALCGTLRSGTVMLPQMIIDSENNVVTTNKKWLAKLQLQLQPWVTVATGPLLNSDRVVTTASQKQQLHANYQAVALDMESMAIAKIAQMANLPFLAIRVIVDEAHHMMPTAAINAVDVSGGDMQYLKFVKNLLLHPQQIIPTLTLSYNFFRANKVMNKVADVLDIDITVLKSS